MEKREATFRESVDLMFDRAAATLDLPPGLGDQIDVFAEHRNSLPGGPLGGVDLLLMGFEDRRDGQIFFTCQYTRYGANLSVLNPGSPIGCYRLPQRDIQATVHAIGSGTCREAGPLNGGEVH